MRHAELLVIPLLLATVISGGSQADPDTVGPAATVWYQRDVAEYQGAWSVRDVSPTQGISVYGMARSADGSFYICDSTNNRLQKFSAAGQFLKFIGSEGNAPGQLDSPHGIRFSFDGSYWVTERDNYRVQHFSAADAPMGSFGSEGGSHGQFNEPRDVLVATDGSLWVADTYNDRLEHFDATGKYLGTIGTTGRDAGEFDHPRGIGSDYSGRLYVTDSQNARVQVFSPTGAFVRSIGSYGSAPGQFKFPYYVAVWLDGSFFVTDNDLHRLHHFDPAGKFLSYWGRADGTYGFQPGEFISPMGVVVDLNGTVYVVDVTGRVQRFAPKVYPTGDKTVTLAGTIAGLGKKDQKRVRVVAVGVVKGVTFFAIATPGGKTNAFSFSGFPKRAPYTIYVTGYDARTYTLTPATQTGKAKKDVSDIVFTLAK